MIFRTERCGEYGHPEFVLEVRDTRIPKSQIARFVETLEGMVASGSVFRPGKTIQVGWMITRVVEHEGDLSLFEPDMESSPVKFVSGISETLHHKMLQLFLIDSFGIPRSDMQIPNIRQSALVCTRYHKTADLGLMRNPPDGDDSGWFICCLDDDHDHDEEIKTVSLYEALINCRSIQGWVAFPFDTVIVLKDRQSPRVMRGDDDLAIIPGSYLDKLLT